MYSETIKTQMNGIFKELKKDIENIVFVSGTKQEIVTKVTSYASKEMTNKSKAVLSSMLKDLNKKTLDCPEFSSTSAKLIFMKVDLYSEINNKYNFTVEEHMDYKEASKILHYLVAPVSIGAVAGSVTVGGIKLADFLGLALTTASPKIPVCAAIVGSIGTFLVEVLYNRPRCSRKKVIKAVDEYLSDMQKQFCGWLDEVEIYYNRRVGEIKQEIGSDLNG